MKIQDAKRLKQVTMYVSFEEYERIKMRAAAAGISAYLKHLVIADFGAEWPGESRQRGQRQPKR